MSARVNAGVTLALVGGLIVAAAPSAASAASSTTIDFTASGYSVGALKPAGQNGWWQAKAADFSLVDNDTFPAAGLAAGGRSLQFSNATIPSGGAHLVSPTVDAAGEPSTSAPNNTFETEFTVASATGGIQDGLGVDVALDGASRFGGVVNLRHTTAGLEIGSYWVPQDATTVDNASWRSAVFATVDATQPHTVLVRDVFLAGQADSFQVFVDGALVSDGSGATTWEYYSTIASPGSGDRSVDGISFKASASAPSPTGIGYTAGLPTLSSAAGKGFLFTGISFESFMSAPPLPTQEPSLPSTPAVSPDAVITLNDDSVNDSTLEFTATGYLPYENIYATIFPVPTFGGWFQADSTGSVSGTLTLEPSLSYGSHTLQLTGSVTGWVASAPFTKIPVPIPTDPPALPSTPATSPDAPLELENASVTGGTLEFSAQGFAPYENVSATVFPTPRFGGWFQADVTGRVTGSVTLPSDLAYGAHTLQLDGSTSGWIASSAFSKVPEAIPTEPPVLAPAPEPTPDEVLELGDDTVTGPTIHVTAQGFLPFENVFVTFFSTPTFGGWLQADANGVIDATITVPAGLPAGEHTLQLTGSVSGWVASAPFVKVAAVGDPSPGTPSPTAQLPLTGLDMVGPLALAELLIIAGLLTAVVARVRRQRA